MAEHERDGSQAEDEVKVTDRRLFTADGQLRGKVIEEEEDEQERDDPAPMPEPPRERASALRDPGAGFERRPVEEPPGVDFTMLINAMAEPALLFLGEIPYPGTGKPTIDLERARIQIDMLDLLRVKCRGNLDREEEGLLDRVLYQLRMLYVARANQPAQ
jgi:hypothetical protein